MSGAKSDLTKLRAHTRPLVQQDNLAQRVPLPVGSPIAADDDISQGREVSTGVARPAQPERL